MVHSRRWKGIKVQIFLFSLFVHSTWILPYEQYFTNKVLWLLRMQLGSCCQVDCCGIFPSILFVSRIWATWSICKSPSFNIDVWIVMLRRVVNLKIIYDKVLLFLSNLLYFPGGKISWLLWLASFWPQKWKREQWRLRIWFMSTSTFIIRNHQQIG